MFPITAILDEPPALTIVDVGAMDLGNAPRWQRLLDAGAARVLGFEPVEAECARLNASAAPGHRYLPYAIGDGTRRTLHVTRFPACTSLYAPNASFLELFQDLAPLFEVVSSESVATRRLDDIDELRETGCDFMKLDIQGAEVDALEHATRLLATTLVVETEVIFTPMYAGQPGLGDIDRVLRRNGFIIHRHLGNGGRTLKPMLAHGGPGAYLSQQLWCDMVYVKDFTRAASLPTESWIKFAMLMHEVFDAFDLAHLALVHADRRAGSALAARYSAAHRAAWSPSIEGTGH